MHKVIILLFILTSCSNNHKVIVKNLITETKHIKETEEKANFIAHKLLSKPYISNPLGDGKNAKYNQKPIYRTDGFDCLTFIEFVSSLSLAHNLQDFEKIMLDLKYKNSDKPSFINRNHFTSIDWQENNINKEYFYNLNNNLNAKISFLKKNIDKKNWYRKQKINSIFRPNLTQEEKKDLLQELQNEGKNMKITQINYPFISKKFILSSNFKLISKNFPNTFLIFIVKDNNLKNIIGTDLIITHTGIGIKENEEIYLIHASTESKKIEKIKLTKYFAKYKNINKEIGVSFLAFNLSKATNH